MIHGLGIFQKYYKTDDDNADGERFYYNIFQKLYNILRFRNANFVEKNL